MEKASTVVKKLASIIDKVKHVEKRGHNSFHNYDYVTESDMVEALRQHLSEAGIISVPHLERLTATQLDKGMIVTIEMSYTFTDGNESVVVRVGGMGSDTPGDKAVYKAMTGAEKYALKQLFLIPTGDDPERDEKDQESARRPAVVDSGAAGRTSSSRGTPSPDGKARKDDRPSEEKDRTVAFGKNKGKTLDQLNEKDLADWTKACEEAVAKAEPKWHKYNVARLEACQKEWANRQPWRAHWKKCLEIGAEFGLDEVGVQSILKDRMGVKSADLLEPGDPDDLRGWLEEEQRKGG